MIGTLRPCLSSDTRHWAKPLLKGNSVKPVRYKGQNTHGASDLGAHLPDGIPEVRVSDSRRRGEDAERSILFFQMEN